MSTGMIGSIMMFGGNYAPNCWLLCDGTLLQISGQYNDLYNAIGNTYGGDGRTTFALPDMRGRVTVHAGQGVFTSRRMLGQSLGQGGTPGCHRITPHSTSSDNTPRLG